MFECNFNVTQCKIPAGWLHIPIGWRLTEANYATTPQIGFISRVILSMQGSAEQFQQIIVKSDLFLSFCRSKCQCFSSFVITGFKGAKHLETDCLPSLPWKNLGQEAREVQFNVIVFLCSAAATKNIATQFKSFKISRDERPGPFLCNLVRLPVCRSRACGIFLGYELEKEREGCAQWLFSKGALGHTARSRKKWVKSSQDEDVK